MRSVALAAISGVAIVALVVAVIMTWRWFSTPGIPDTYTGTGTPGACDLPDLSVLERWAPASSPPEHREARPAAPTNTSLLVCKAHTGAADQGPSARLTMVVHISEKPLPHQPPDQTPLTTNSTLPQQDSGHLPGLGADAAYAAGHDSAGTAEYVLVSRDDNLELQLVLRVRATPDAAPQLPAIALHQAHLVMSRLHRTA